MTAGSYLRNNAAVNRMQLGLRKNLIGKYLPSVLDDGDCGLIAGGFK